MGFVAFYNIVAYKTLPVVFQICRSPWKSTQVPVLQCSVWTAFLSERYGFTVALIWPVRVLYAIHDEVPVGIRENSGVK
jgi:hypothetical protein